MKKNRLLALLLAVCMLAGMSYGTAVFAEDGESLSVVSVSKLATNRGAAPVLQEGDTDVSVGLGKVFIAMGGAFDPATLAEGVILKNMTDPSASVAYGVKAADSNNTVVLSMEELDHGTAYQIEINEKLQMPDGRAAQPYTLNFTTTDQEYIFEQDFEGMELGEIDTSTDVPVNPTIADESQEEAFFLSKADKLDPDNLDRGEMSVREDVDGNQVLFLKPGISTVGNGGASLQYRAVFNRPSINGGQGMRTSFEVDMRMRINKGTKSTYEYSFRTGAPHGRGSTNAFMLYGGQSSMAGTHYPIPNDLSKSQLMTLLPNVEPTKFYDIKLVYRVNETDQSTQFGKRFDLDVYVDQGNGWELAVDGFHGHSQTPDTIEQIRLAEVTFPTAAIAAECDGTMELDDIRIYDHTPVQLLGSSIQDGQSNVQDDQVSLTFNTDMREASFADKIMLKNVSTEETVPLAGSYADRVFTADLPALEESCDYEIVIGNVLTEDGKKFDSENVIRFSTGTFAPVEINEDLYFSDTEGGAQILSLAGQNNLYLNVPVQKNVTEDVSITPVIALYDEAGKLVQAACETMPVTGTVVSLALEGISPRLGWSAKGMVFQDMANLQPMTEYVEISDKLSANAALAEYFADQDEINIVYLGGSITQGAGASLGKNSWVGRISDTFNRAYPGKVNNYNEGIGGTGSDLGLFRLDEDVIQHDPDLVFVEFAVNDQEQTSEQSQYYMEGIVRNLLALEKQPIIVFVYTTTQQFMARTEDHQKVADYYGIPSIDLQAYTKDLYDKGELKINDFLGDGTHPHDRGYLLYAEYIMSKLNQPEEYLRPAVMQEAPLNAGYHPYVGQKVNADQFEKSGAWSTPENAALYPNSLISSEQDAALTYTFEGPFVGIVHQIGNSFGKCEIYIDDVLQTTLDTYAGNNGQPVMRYKNDTLTDAEHTLKIKVLGDKNPSSTGNKIQIDSIYVKK